MKNLLKFSLVLAVAMSTVGMYASEVDFSGLVDSKKGEEVGTTSEYHKPILVYKDGIVTLSILNFKETPVDVVIYDEYNSEVFNDTFTGKQDFFKRFDVSKIAKGQYTFEVSYSNKSYVETVSTK